MKPLSCASILLLAPLASSQDAPVGVFFDAAGTTRTLEVAPLTPFPMYVVAHDLSLGVLGYEFELSLDPAILVTQRTSMPPASSIDVGSGPDNWVVGTGQCLTGSSEILVQYTCMLLTPASDLAIYLGPSNPSSFGGSTPGMLTCQSPTQLRSLSPAYAGPALVNPRPIGTSFCTAHTNSTGAPAALMAQGSLYVENQDLVLMVDQLPPNQFGLFFMSQQTAHVPFFAGSQGVLCLGMPQIRFNQNIVNSGAQGMVTLAPSFTSLPQQTTFGAGQSWHFQFWYRDQNPSPTSNTSGGLSITWQ